MKIAAEGGVKGIDYLQTYWAYRLGYEVYTVDSIGTLHIPNTSYINHLQTKTEDQATFLNAARVEMLNVLVRKYGRSWGQEFLRYVPSDTNDGCFANWSKGDRTTALNWNSI